LNSNRTFDSQSFTIGQLLLAFMLLIGLGARIGFAQAGDLPLNPGFETGSFSPWSSWQDTSVVNNNAHSGAYAVQITGEGSAEQVVSGLTDNITYTLTAWGKAETEGDEICIGAKNYDNSGEQVVACLNSTSYSQGTVSFTIMEGLQSVKVFCYHAAAGITGYCDDYTLTSQTTPPPDDAVQPVGIPGTWTLVFADEFEGTSLSTADWQPNWVVGSSSTEITPPVNPSELAAYDPAQVTVSGGYLNLSLVENPVTLNGDTYAYRSGMIQTNGRIGQTPLHEFTFGAFEARINLPAARRTRIANWPAWWTDGQNWPIDGEMDIMEGLSGNAAYHFHNAETGAEGEGDFVPGDFTGWHTYGANWQEGSITFYYDGIEVGTITNGITSSPMYLILNYATGGSGGRVTAPATMQVDYVRVWRSGPE
jgi:beta-glucanase (GH16 family)